MHHNIKAVQKPNIIFDMFIFVKVTCIEELLSENTTRFFR
jgi:hypothetical protein